MVDNFPSSLNINSQELSQEEKDFINLVVDGGGFVNPVANEIADAKNKATAEKAAVAGLNIVISSGIGTQATNVTLDTSPIEDALDGLIDTLNSFKTHTDRLSGVVIHDPNLTDPYINTLLSMGTTYISQLKNMGKPTAGKFEAIFGSLIEGPELVSESKRSFANATDVLQDAADDGDTQEELESLVSSYASDVNEAKADISQQMTDDDNAFDEAWDYVIKFALGRYIKSVASADEYANHLLTNFCGSSQLIDLINTSEE